MCLQIEHKKDKYDLVYKIESMRVCMTCPLLALNISHNYGKLWSITHLNGIQLSQKTKANSHMWPQGNFAYGVHHLQQGHVSINFRASAFTTLPPLLSHTHILCRCYTQQKNRYEWHWKNICYPKVSINCGANIEVQHTRWAPNKNLISALYLSR